MEKIKSYKEFLIEAKQLLSNEKYYIDSYDESDEKDKEFIRINRKMLYKFLDDGYKYAKLGNFKGCRNDRSLYKNFIFAKIAREKDTNDIIAMSVYSNINKGKKCVGITATTDPKLRELGKEALKEIIKIDVSNWKNWYWVEASGAIEKYFLRFGGFAIPNIYAPEIITHKTVILCEDDEHFYIEGDEEVKKCIIGFNSKETFEKVREEYKEKVNKFLSNLDKKIDEEAKSSFGKMTRVEAAMNVIYHFVSNYEENGDVYYPQEIIDKFNSNAKFLKSKMSSSNVSKDDSIKIKRCLYNANEISKRLKVLKLHKFE